MSEEFREFYLGRTKEALLEEEMELDGMRYFTGYTKEYVKVAVRRQTDMPSNTMVPRHHEDGRLNRRASILWLNFNDNYHIRIKTAMLFRQESGGRQHRFKVRAEIRA